MPIESQSVAHPSARPRRGGGWAEGANTLTRHGFLFLWPLPLIASAILPAPSCSPPPNMTHAEPFFGQRAHTQNARLALSLSLSLSLSLAPPTHTTMCSLVTRSSAAPHPMRIPFFPLAAPAGQHRKWRPSPSMWEGSLPPLLLLLPLPPMWQRQRQPARRRPTTSATSAGTQPLTRATSPSTCSSTPEPSRSSARSATTAQRRQSTSRSTRQCTSMSSHSHAPTATTAAATRRPFACTT
jgi:hypothetical protein